MDGENINEKSLILFCKRLFPSRILRQSAGGKIFGYIRTCSKWAERFPRLRSSAFLAPCDSAEQTQIINAPFHRF